MPARSAQRPSLEAIPAASSSSSALQLHHPHHEPNPLYPLFASLVFHIIPAKLENDLAVIYRSIEDLGGRCDGLEGSRWVVTALKGRARLGKVLGKYAVSSGMIGDGAGTNGWKETKPILSTEWIYDTYTRALEASTHLDGGVIPTLPDVKGYMVLPFRPGTEDGAYLLPDSSSSESEPEEEGRPRKKRKLNRTKGGLPDLKMWDEDIDLDEVPRYCIERPSPLVCANQDLVSSSLTLDLLQITSCTGSRSGLIGRSTLSSQSTRGGCLKRGGR
jgi:DNA polymerase mu